MVDKNSSVLFLVIVLGLFVMPVNASNITNGDFETGDFTGWTLFGTHNPTLVNLSGEYGNYTASCSGNGETTYAGLYQEYDNALYSKIDLDMLYNRVGGNAHFYIYNNDDIIYSLGPYVLYNGHISVNLTDYNGQGKIYFKAYYQGYARIDNIVLTPYEVPPDVDDVFWGSDPYYTGEIGKVTTNIVDFDDGTYSYYLDLYNSQGYLTTYEITSPIESNYYTFPMDWADTSLVAKLIRVTDPYATNEVELAYDVSLFESLYWDTTVAFNKSSYIPSESLLVTWSGAADGSSVWLQAGDDGEVLESDVAYSGSFTFDVPANTTETYYWVDVVTDGYSQAFAICDISPIPDFFFNYSVVVDQDEYVHGDWVNVTYSTNEPAVIKVFDDTNADIWHYLDVPAAVTNETWMYYIGDTDPYGSFSVLFGNDNFLVSDYYSVVSSTSFVQVVPESMYMYETMKIWYVTNGSSTLSIKDSSDSILFQQTVNSSSLESISYIPTVSGILTITLSDVPADATDSIIVYWAEDPDDLPDDDIIDDDVIEDVLEDDETMTEYFNEKFRDFAPTIWGFFMLMCLLFLMSIFTSFNSGGKR